jgi:hypothetical protein
MTSDPASTVRQCPRRSNPSTGVPAARKITYSGRMFM